MNAEQKDYLDTMEDLMMQKGWKVFIDDLKTNLAAIKESAIGFTTERQLHEARGRANTLADIIGLESFLNSVREQAAAEKDDVAV